MGNLFSNSGPENCESSEEAKRMGDIFMSMGDARFDDADGEIGLGSSLSAASAYKKATKYYERAEYLKSQGK